MPKPGWLKRQFRSAAEERKQYPPWMLDEEREYGMDFLEFLRGKTGPDPIEIDSNKRSGVPVFRGTRVPVYMLFAELADGKSVIEFAEDMDLDAGVLRGILERTALWFDRSFTGEDECPS